MKTISIVIGVFALGLLLGQFIFSGSDMSSSADGQASEEKKPLYWVAPMDKNYRREGPGKSPMGMDLVPVYEENSGSGGEHSVAISPIVENNLGVKLERARRGQLMMPIHTVARVQFDESRIVHVHSRVEGWLERLGVAASGDRVTKGQLLFELYSPALVSAQEEFVAALATRNRHLIKASKSKLVALGIRPEQVKALQRSKQVAQNVKFYAERDGVVVALNVRKGMHIKPATEVLSVAALDSVWLLADVLERQAHLIAPGMSVEAHWRAMPERRWQGNVNYIYPELNPQSQTLVARIRLANPDHVLKPNMLMDVSLLAQSVEQVITIPRHALIKMGSHNRVVKALGDGRYQSVLVEVGQEGVLQAEDGQGVEEKAWVQILKGLDEGDLVVSSAQFLIDSESNIEAELLRMQMPEDPGPLSAPKNKVLTKGRVEQVMAAMGMVKISHQPIPEWDWPEMTMDFALAESISLQAFKVGEQIDFELEKMGDRDYRISALAEQNETLANKEQAGLKQDMGHEHHRVGGEP